MPTIPANRSSTLGVLFGCWLTTGWLTGSGVLVTGCSGTAFCCGDTSGMDCILKGISASEMVEGSVTGCSLKEPIGCCCCTGCCTGCWLNPPLMFGGVPMFVALKPVAGCCGWLCCGDQPVFCCIGCTGCWLNCGCTGC
ncbi:hypothetical protein [Kochikohdavirus PBEF19]|uniref:Uncharacterized protein n=1 Tax=Enterococcus phage PBEF129 TaxID=2696337 RepID=A0A7T3JER6_9CAUD|nr:hypothetical protein [Enterococcus phage PBEF129]